jgi:RNA polymerase sigma factor (TIGR02999 family)
MTEISEHEALSAHAAPTPRASLDRAYARRYADLCRIARARLRGLRPLDLDSNSLVHESFLRLAVLAPTLADARHFFAYAAKVMRNIAIDAVRRPETASTGADDAGNEETSGSWNSGTSAMAERVHDALLALESEDPGLATCVRMRYFEGRSEQEIAGLTGTSRRTVRRQWERARTLLQQLLRE